MKSWRERTCESRNNIPQPSIWSFPLEYPNECGERDIKRKDMKTHLEVCPLQPLDCPYKDAGCTDKIDCEDMESHVEVSIEEHLRMVFQSFQGVMKSNRELKTHIEKLETCIETLEKRKK